MDVKLCKDKCVGYDALVNDNALIGVNSASKLLVATLLVYLSILDFDDRQENKI